MVKKMFCVRLLRKKNCLLLISSEKKLYVEAGSRKKLKPRRKTIASHVSNGPPLSVR